MIYIFPHIPHILRPGSGMIRTLLKKYIYNCGFSAVQCTVYLAGWVNMILPLSYSNSEFSTVCIDTYLRQLSISTVVKIFLMSPQYSIHAI